MMSSLEIVSTTSLSEMAGTISLSGATAPTLFEEAMVTGHSRMPAMDSSKSAVQNYLLRK